MSRQPINRRTNCPNYPPKMVGKFMFAMPLLQHLAIKFKSHASLVHTTSQLYQRTTMKTHHHLLPSLFPSTPKTTPHIPNAAIHPIFTQNLSSIIPHLWVAETPQSCHYRRFFLSYSCPKKIPSQIVENLLNFLHCSNLLDKNSTTIRSSCLNSIKDVIKMSSHVLGTIYIYNIKNKKIIKKIIKK